MAIQKHQATFKAWFVCILLGFFPEFLVNHHYVVQDKNEHNEKIFKRNFEQNNDRNVKHNSHKPISWTGVQHSINFMLLVY